MVFRGDYRPIPEDYDFWPMVTRRGPVTVGELICFDLGATGDPPETTWRPVDGEVLEVKREGRRVVGYLVRYELNGQALETWIGREFYMGRPSVVYAAGVS